MLGNDVIDLADPETHTRHPGFDARVFSTSERDLIARSDAPHAARQSLWAAKESAYKAARRRDSAVAFSPIRFEVGLDDAGHGTARHASGIFEVAVTRSGDCIHAIACFGRDPRESRSSITDVSREDASTAVREFALVELSDALELPRSELSIGRNGRIPQLCLRGSTLPAPLSLSHHGRFAAYAALT
jgi:phosphopantetheinyl transferase (holo-ACP synthase)